MYRETLAVVAWDGKIGAQVATVLEREDCTKKGTRRRKVEEAILAD